MSLPQISAIGGLVSKVPRPSLKTSSSVSNYNGLLVMPTGIVAGDLIVVVQAMYDETNGSTPSVYVGDGAGFTRLISGGSSTSTTGPEGTVTSRQQMSVDISYKVADGSESGSTISGFGDGQDWESAYILVFETKRPSPVVSHVGFTSGICDSTPSIAQHINIHVASAKTSGATINGVDQWFLFDSGSAYTGYSILDPGGAVSEITATGTVPRVSRSGYIEVV